MPYTALANSYGVSVYDAYQLQGSGCGIDERTRIETFKRKANFGYRYTASAYY